MSTRKKVINILIYKIISILIISYFLYQINEKLIVWSVPLIDLIYILKQKYYNAKNKEKEKLM